MYISFFPNIFFVFCKDCRINSSYSKKLFFFLYYRKRIKNSGPILLPELNERPKRKDWKKKKPKDLEKLKNNPIKVPLIQLQDNSFLHLLNSLPHQQGEGQFHHPAGPQVGQINPQLPVQQEVLIPLSMVGVITQQLC